MSNKKKLTSSISAPISLGELIDKITILEIKKQMMAKKKRENVEKELEYLNLILKEQSLKIDMRLINGLKEVNRILWDIEDRIRIKERDQKFDKEFIELARSVYKENDRRASIKKEINYMYNSELIEEKSYTKYQ
tara:strand:+ start:121 stop:525 length:405 start_codon:yes stop_codon:yes gene_type:complete